MRTRTTALALVIAAAAAIPSIAQAATSPSPSASPKRSSEATPPHQRDGRRVAQRADVLADVATRLGVTTTQLRTALTSVRQEMKASGDMRLGPGATEAQRQARFDDATARLATKLNLPVVKVRAAITAAHTQEKAERLAALKARLDAAVKAGKLTQAQADAMYAAVRDGKRPAVAMPWGPGHRHHRGPGSDTPVAPGGKAATGATTAA